MRLNMLNSATDHIANQLVLVFATQPTIETNHLSCELPVVCPTLTSISIQQCHDTSGEGNVADDDHHHVNSISTEAATAVK